MPERIVLIIAAALIAGQALAGARQAPGREPNWGQPTAEVHVLVKQALEDLLTRRKLPDVNMFGDSTRIPIREELPRAKLRLGRDALPQRDGYQLYLIAEAQVQAEADRSGATVFYIIVDQPSITGETATLWVGVDLALPRSAKAIKLCCCTGLGHFQRTHGQWMFVKWSGMTCS